MKVDELTTAISLRVSPADREMLTALSERLPMKRLHIARVAMRLGLAVIKWHPSVLITSRDPNHHQCGTCNGTCVWATNVALRIVPDDDEVTAGGNPIRSHPEPEPADRRRSFLWAGEAHRAGALQAVTGALAGPQGTGSGPRGAAAATSKKQRTRGAAGGAPSGPRGKGSGR